MKQIRPILLALVAMLSLQWSIDAEHLSLDYGLNRPFYAPGLNVQWAAPTNALPSTAIVFEVVADEHPDATVSNLMLIGRFRPSDSIQSIGLNNPLPKGMYGFRALDDGRTLFYVSTQGRIDFDEPTAFRRPGRDNTIEGVPDEATVLALALRLLPKLGISTNDMVRKESGVLRCVFPTGSFAYGSEDLQVYRRGIGFTRSLDGKEIDGQRAVFIEFGNEARLGKIEVRWRSLRPKGSYPVAQPVRILQWIREGRAVVLSLSGPNDARYVRVEDIRKLTITSIQPRYPYIDEDNTPRHIYPYAFLIAIAEFGANDSEQVFLSCPLIGEGLPKVQCPAHADFSIYPSKRSR